VGAASGIGDSNVGLISRVLAAASGGREIVAAASGERGIVAADSGERGTVAAASAFNGAVAAGDAGSAAPQFKQNLAPARLVVLQFGHTVINGSLLIRSGMDIAGILEGQSYISDHNFNTILQHIFTRWLPVDIQAVERIEIFDAHYTGCLIIIDASVARRYGGIFQDNFILPVAPDRDGQLFQDFNVAVFVNQSQAKAMVFIARLGWWGRPHGRLWIDFISVHLFFLVFRPGFTEPY
jgi:hypothetical protein